MAAQVIPAKSPEGPLPEVVAGLRYVARQPILDLRGRVHGYELLFRAGPDSAFRGDGEEMPSLEAMASLTEIETLPH